MHAERDWLRHHVFPRLEEALCQRRHHFEAVDLRVGVGGGRIPDEETRELHVLKVCLSEVQRSRPFLLVLLGDRYGWVPPRERLQAAAREAGFDGHLQDQSVTALEIEFGVFKEFPEQRRRCLFYLREPLPYDVMPPDVAGRYNDAWATDPEAPTRAAALQALKAKLAADPELAPRIRRYTVRWDEATHRVAGLEAWGEQVFQDLWGELDDETREFAQRPVPGWEQVERAALAEFVEHRARDFAGRADLTDRLLALARSAVSDEAAWGACVTGTSGSGKSALFAHLCRQVAADPSVLLLAHAAGISPRGSHVDAMLRLWIGELSSFLQVERPLTDTATNEEVERVFVSLLGRVAQRRRVVVLLDALDQFESTPRGRHLTWLSPRQWPANVRLVATSLPGEEADSLAQWAGIDEIELPALTEDDAQRISRGVWARYRHELDPEVWMQLAEARDRGAPACGNPLWVTLANEQLNLLDADAFERAEREFEGSSSDRLHRLLLHTARRLPSNVEGLYDWLLTDAERVHGAAWIRAFASVIAVSRFGWRESDLRVLVPLAARLFPPTPQIEEWGDLKAAELRRAFRAHLMLRGGAGQWDFFHAQAREAVKRRNLADGGLRTDLHSAIVSYLATLPAEDPLRESESMFHLIGAGDLRQAADYYGGDRTAGELAGATRVLAAHVLAGEQQEPNPGLGWVLSLVDVPLEELSTVAALCNRFQFDLHRVVESQVRLQTLHALHAATRRTWERLAAADRANVEWQRGLSISYVQLGNVLYAQGDLSGALAAYRPSLEIRERLASANPIDAVLQCDVSAGHQRLGDVLSAQGDLDGALKAYRAGLRFAEGLVARDPSNQRWLWELAANHSGIGAGLRAQGDSAAALVAFRAGLAILEALAAEDRSNTLLQQHVSIAHQNVGEVLSAQGNLADALIAHRASRQIAERLAALDPSDTQLQWLVSTSHERIGYLLRRLGDLRAAAMALRAGLAIRARLTTTDPSNVDWQAAVARCHGMLGEVLGEQGNSQGALAAFRTMQGILNQLAAADPSNAGRQGERSLSYVSTGDALLAQGEVAGALEAYRTSLEICERLVALDPANTQWQWDVAASHERMGNVLVAQGNLTAALVAYRMLHGIVERLVALDPSNMQWQRDLGLSYTRIGDVLRAQGDSNGALEAHRVGLKIRERLTALDPSNTGWQWDLTVSHERVATVLSAQGDLRGALVAYRTMHAVLERLVASDPSNRQWQHDLALSSRGVGDVLRGQGDLAGAMAAYQASLETGLNLAATDPSHTAWHWELAISYERVGDIWSASGDLSGALTAYRMMQEILDSLARESCDARCERDLSVSHTKVGDVLFAKSEMAGALAAYRAGLEIRDRLLALDSSNTLWRCDLAASHQRVGDVLRSQGDVSGALAAYRKATSMLEHLVALDPQNMQWQADLSLVHQRIAEMRRPR